MPTDFTLPELGENITAGDVVRVLVSPGDTVTKDQPLLELETDKATIEVPSTVSGTVKEIKVKAGREDQGRRGRADGRGWRGRGGWGRGCKPCGQRAKRQEPKPQPAGAPDEGGRVRDARRSGSPPRASRTSRSPSPSRSAARSSTSAAGRARTVTADPAAAPGGAEAEGPPPPAAPSVRRLARELGVDIRRVAGSGPAGRISVEDVQAFVRSAHGRRRRCRAALGGSSAARLRKWGEVERKPMSNIRRKTAEHLSHAWNTIPHVTQHDKADITALEALRKQYSPQAEKPGGKLTMTAIALKIVAGALKRFPQFNSSIDAARNEIVYKQVDSRRRRGRHRARPARAGDSRRRPQGRPPAGGRARRGVREGAGRQALARRDAGRRLHDHQSRRHRRHVVHADRQLAGGRDPRHLARRAGAGLRRPDDASSRG